MTGIEVHLYGKRVNPLQAAQAVSVVGARGVRIGFPAEDGDLLDYIDLYGRSRVYGEIQPPLGSSSAFGADATRMRQRAEMLVLAAEIAELAEMIAAEQAAPALEPAGRALEWCAAVSQWGTLCVKPEHGAGAAHADRDDAEFEAVTGACGEDGSDGRREILCTLAPHDPAATRHEQRHRLGGVTWWFTVPQQWHCGACENDYTAKCPRCPMPGCHKTREQELVPAPGLVGRLVEDAHDDSPCPAVGKVVGQVDEGTVEVLWGERQYEENPGTGSYEPVDALRPARGSV